MANEQFKAFLEKSDLSKNTVTSYVWTVNHFITNYGDVNKENLLAYKGFLVEHFKPQTVNLRLQALNRYLEFIKKDKMKLKFVKKKKLKADGHLEWYFVVWFMAATGARVSELLQIKVEHVEAGYLDMYSKGGKIRRLYIPKTLREEAVVWLKNENLTSGYVFRNRYGNVISTRGISQQLKHFANQYGINPKVVYPHSFRHRYAKNFLEKYNDIALLADLMGHESIETTRIYLRRTATEQRQIVDEVVTW